MYNPSIDHIIDQFEMYRSTQPNIVECWISYLALKKRHYGRDEKLIRHCEHVLHNLSLGHCDITRDDLLRLTLYKLSL